MSSSSGLSVACLRTGAEDVLKCKTFFGAMPRVLFLEVSYVRAMPVVLFCTLHTIHCLRTDRWWSPNAR